MPVAPVSHITRCLARVKAALDAGESIDQTFYAPRKQWNMNKDALAVGEDGEPWWAENSKEAYSSGIEALAKGLPNWSKSRKGATGRAARPGSQNPRPRTRRHHGSRTRLAGLA